MPVRAPFPQSGFACRAKSSASVRRVGPFSRSGRFLGGLHCCWPRDSVALSARLRVPAVAGTQALWPLIVHGPRSCFVPSSLGGSLTRLGRLRRAAAGGDCHSTGFAAKVSCRACLATSRAGHKRHLASVRYDSACQSEPTACTVRTARRRREDTPTNIAPSELDDECPVVGFEIVGIASGSDSRSISRMKLWSEGVCERPHFQTFWVGSGSGAPIRHIRMQPSTRDFATVVGWSPAHNRSC